MRNAGQRIVLATDLEARALHGDGDLEPRDCHRLLRQCRIHAESHDADLAIADVDLVAEIGCVVRMTYGDQLDRPIDVASATAAFVERGIWLRPLGDILYTTPPLIAGEEEVARIAAAVAPEVFERVKSLTQESSVLVTGKVRADARAPAATRSPRAGARR